MVEIYFNVQSDNGSITDEHALRRWSTQYLRALEDRKDLRIGSKLRTLMTEAGFVEVDTKMIPLPLSAWSTGWYLAAQDERTSLIFIQCRPADARYRPTQLCKHAATAPLPRTIPIDSTSAYGSVYFQCFGEPSAARGSRPHPEGIFPTVGIVPI